MICNPHQIGAPLWNLEIGARDIGSHIVIELFHIDFGEFRVVDIHSIYFVECDIN